MKLLVLALAATLAVGSNAQLQCNVPEPDKVDCGEFGSTQQSCEADNCCWVPAGEGSVTPWCFYPEGSGHTNPPSVCDDITWTGASSPGFTQADRDTMYANYQANLNIENCGAVVASQDTNTPGGSYYYHWMRDAGLSIKAWLDINDNVVANVQAEVDPYVDWVGIVQHKPDANVDVRVEPKFYIPSGDPYDGGWCRPQTDGPALRAMALSKYGQMVLDAGDSGTANAIWDLIQFDMEWVLPNWDQSGCDLWEEVTSDDFYWNRMAYVYSLNEAAKFADSMGKPDGDTWRSKADEILPTAAAHYQNGFIYESTNRQQDGSVIHAIATFGEYLFAPDSPEAAETIDLYAWTFCNEYPINQADVGAGLDGILIGRYPGDSYGGGNPWQLLTAALGETFYKASAASFKKIQDRGENPILTLEEHSAWMRLLHLDQEKDVTLMDLALRQLDAGNSVMNRLYTYVSGDGMRIDEQIDKNSGVQTSAEGLTWSYANILHALWEYDNTLLIKEQVMAKY